MVFLAGRIRCRERNEIERRAFWGSLHARFFRKC